MRWQVVPLKTISELGPQYGANLRAIPPSGKGIRYVRITDIDDFGELRPDSFVEPDGNDLENYLLSEGDLLLARSGATVGKSYRHIPENGQCAFAGYLIRFRPNARIVNSCYLNYFLQSSTYWIWVNSKKRVAAQPNISGAEYATIPVPLPPLSEQHRFVEILDEADRLRRLRREADAKAVRILPALFLKMFGDPATNPKGWAEKPLREAIAIVDAGWSATSEARLRQEHEFGVLKVSAVTSGRCLAEEHKAVIDLSETRTLVCPRRGDLLFSRANTRELVAASCIVDVDHPKLFLSDKLWRLTPRDRVASTLFLKELFWNDGVREKFRVASSGSSGSMLNISQEAMLRTVVPMPPYELQIKFEAIAWRLIEITNQARNAASKIDSIWETLMQRAFSGQLTAKWREAHSKELLAEMEQQARLLNLPLPKELELAP